MNIKDLGKLRLMMERNAKDVYLVKPDHEGEPTSLQIPVTGNFMETMVMFLSTKSEQGKRPVTITIGGKPMYDITIKPAGFHESQQESGIIRPGLLT